MLELNQKLYYELDISELENLMQSHFQKYIDFVARMELGNDNYYIPSLFKLDDQILTQDLINEVLEDNVELIDNAVWLLQMKKVLPSGNYLISVNW